MIPIEIINKILVYVGELNDSTIITQYHPITNEEHYIINFNSGLLCKIKTTFIMKRVSPQYNLEYFCNKRNRELYQSGIDHYEKLLKNKK